MSHNELIWLVWQSNLRKQIKAVLGAQGYSYPIQLNRVRLRPMTMETTHLIPRPYTEALASFLTQSELTLQKLSKKVRKAVIEASLSFDQKPMFIDATSCEYQLTEKADRRPRFALVIGNSNYSAVPLLKNPGNDAKLMAGKLIELDFQVNLMIDRSHEQMKSAITEL